MVAGYVALFSWLSLRKHETFHTGNDLAVFAQVVWNTTQGRLFETSLVAEATNFLGQHFSPILALFTPLYFLWPDARLLLVAQALIVALGAVPIYAYASRKLGGSPPALIVAAAYFLFPATQFVTLDEFHPISLAIPLLSLAGYALLTRRYRSALVIMAVSLLVKEEMAIVLAGMGLFVLLAHRRVRLGALMTAAGGVAAWLLLYVIIPGLAKPGYAYVFTNRYDYLGENLTDIVVHIVTEPQLVMPQLLAWPKTLFLVQLLGPLAFLPLLAPATLFLAVPTFAYLLLSDYPFQYSIAHHYTAPLIPLLFLAAVDGLDRLIRCGQAQGRDWRMAGRGLLLTGTLLGFLLWAPAPGGGRYDPTAFTITAHSKAGQRILRQIPAEASVAAEWKFYPHLSNRRMLGDLLNPRFSPADYVLVDRAPGGTSAPEYPHVLLPPRGGLYSYPLFETVAKEDGYILSRYIRDLPLEQPADVLFGDRVRLVAWGWLAGPNVHAGGETRLVLAWQATRHLNQRYAFFVHLLNRTGPGATLLAQDDRELGGGVYPTTMWDQWGEDKVLADEYTLTIPEGLAPGSYPLTVGVYPQRTGLALTGTDAQGRVLGNEVFLTTVRVLSPPRGDAPQ